VALAVLAVIPSAAARTPQPAADPALANVDTFAPAKGVDLSSVPKEAGAVVLPRWVFAALQSSQKGQWTVADVGTVATFISMFTERRSLIVDTHFEDSEEGELILVGRGSLTRIRFEPGVNPPLEAPSGAGYVDLPRAVERLAANGWLDVRERSGGRIEIRPGTRARKLLERDHGGS